MMFCIGGLAGGRPASSSIREASSSTFCRSSASCAMTGKGLYVGLEPTGCCIET